MKINILYLLLVVSLVKEIIFSAIIPMWHVPDEQAHFAQVAYFAERGMMPLTAPDLNQEILTSEELLGTSRDERGNNNFTFHPEFRIEYTNSTIGKYEEIINNIPISNRQKLVKQEATYYPPLFYLISSIPYKIFYQFGLIDRVFLTRIVSILLSVSTVYVGWLIAKKLFKDDEVLQLTLPIILSFQPMFSFLGAGVNSDNLMNFLFTLFLYYCILIIMEGISKRLLILLLINLILLYFTKPQFLFTLPILLLAFILSIFGRKKIEYKYIFRILLFVILFFGIIVLLISGKIDSFITKYTYFFSFNPNHLNNKVTLSFLEFLKQSLIHLYAEVVPWYWGVFNWLGVTYPREVHRVINRILVIAIIGIFIKFILIMKKRSKEDLIFLFLLISSVIYFVGVTYYNYLFTLGHGYQFGIQGRYFFPTIIAHMGVILVGIITLVPKHFKNYMSLIVKTVGILMIFLNFVAIWILSVSYYDLSSFNTFIIQSSQYKPIFFKGYFLIFWISLYIILFVLFIYKYLRLKKS